MPLLPRRHPQKDFFLLDIADVMPKDDTASMEHPFFSLSTKPDMRELTYGTKGNSLRIVPSGRGLPTVKDKDILIFCISQLVHRKNQGLDIGRQVRFSAREMMVATNRPDGGNSYRRLEDAFIRLSGTRFVSDIRTGGKVETRVFGMVEEGGFVRTDDGRFQLDYCEVVLSDWMMRAIEASEVLTISEDYFRLSRPLERRLYEIARKHCGQSPRWQIGLAKLQTKTGSNAPLKRFRHNLREVIEADVTPDYRFELAENDLVVVRPRKVRTAPITTNITIPDWAEERARIIAREKGWDYHVLRGNWLTYARDQIAKEQPPKNAGAAFLGYCNKQDNLRHG